MLEASCETLSGVGPALLKKLEKCGISSVKDLLFHLPYRYQDRTRITPIQDLRANDWAVISGYVCKTEVKYGKRRMLYVTVEDKTALLTLRFFNFNQNQVQQFKESQMIRCFGEVKSFNNRMEMIHPEYQLLKEGQICEVEETLTPIYPVTQGLTQPRIRQLITIALKTAGPTLNQLEWMSDEVLTQFKFDSIEHAITVLHRPPPETSISSFEQGSHPALKRLAFEELLAQQISMQFARASRYALSAPICSKDTFTKPFLAELPFDLTNAQKRVCADIHKDLSQSKPMLRLVQGDVGAGKTVIAAIAALQAIANGYQVAFMAPTDILSEQHAINLSNWLEKLQLRVCRLSGKMKAKARRETLTALANHGCDIVIGTHALFQEAVSFSNLGLIIIDEQHRFGVEQRLSLQQKSNQNTTPHQLLMTATPIPRTLAMTQFAHIDISILDELPPGRTPVVTAVLGQNKRAVIIDRLKNAIQSGRQAYWVCTLIEDSEKLQCMAAINTQTELQSLMPDVRIGLVHGRMKAVEKDQVMTDFKAGSIDLLVATTVIEVGVDVPKASLMVIENAERLGLSQLHQLRGRIGRGRDQSHCLLVYQSPLSKIGQERLKIMRDSSDGFFIAEKDLEIRGGGEVLGTRQTGYRQFQIAELPRDKELLSKIGQFAKKLVLQKPETAHEIARRWLGDYDEYLRG